METGAFGWKFRDEIQPILDAYDRQSEDIRRNGAEGQLARMQAVDDAMANSDARQGRAPAVPYGVARQPDQAAFFASDPGMGVPGASTTNSGGGQFSNAGFQIGARSGGFINRPSLGQLGPDGPGSAALVDPFAYRPHMDAIGAAGSQDSGFKAVQSAANVGGHDVRWGQLGKGALMAAGGGLAAATGATLCSTTGMGCIAGAPLAVFGANDAIQGATMFKDALQGHSSEGYNPLRRGLEALYPEWGDFAYDAGEGITALGSLAAKTPLIVDPAVTGINRTKSLFGVTVPRMNNSIPLPFGGKVLDSNAQRGILAVTIGAKTYQASKDYPGN